MRAGLLLKVWTALWDNGSCVQRKWKVPLRPVVVRTMACGETGFPLWNKASVTKITARLPGNFCQENLRVSQGQWD